MAGELVVMSTQELDRLGVIRQVLEQRLTRVKAGHLLGLSARQVARLCRAYGRDGAAGLVSRKRGRSSNRKLSATIETQVVELVRAHYDDFGPTLVREKLQERHGIKLCVETVRRILLKAGIWLPRDQRVPKPHQPRFRRSCLGELVQIDGCEHAWFEDRGPSCSLLVFVDDATSKLMQLHFAPSESTFSYFEATSGYLRHHGKPVAYHSDKHSIFRVAREGTAGAHRGVTQYARALGELNIDIICANSPQAKGRVERMNLTLQDRLVKELRLQGISTSGAANKFAPTFMADYNAKFAKPPQEPFDAHRPLTPGDELDRIFCERDLRTMTSNLVVHFERKSYVVTPTEETRRLAGRRRQVVVHTWADGRMEIHHEGKALPFTAAASYPLVSPGDVVEQKRVGEVMELIRQAQHTASYARPGQPRRPLCLGLTKAALPAPVKPSAAVIELRPRGVGGASPSEVAARFVLRWVRKRAFLYERSVVHETIGGHPVVKDQYLGPVESHVGQQWQERGDFSLPPPLEGGRFPAQRSHSRRFKPAANVFPASPAPSPTPPADGHARLNAALWFTDAFHARESARIREANEAADAEDRARRESLRKPPRRAVIRPMAPSSMARPRSKGETR
jgi:transposase